jgi:hypothetical protein
MESVKDSVLDSNHANLSSSTRDRFVRGDTEEILYSERQALVKEVIERNKKTIQETKSKVRKIGNKNGTRSKENRGSRNKT